MRFILIPCFICSAILLHAQASPDSLKGTYVAGLTEKEKLTIYVSKRSCFGGGFEKFELVKHNNRYSLVTYREITLYELAQRGIKPGPVSPDTLLFIPFKTYTLGDSSVMAWAGMEFLGVRYGLLPRSPGSAYRKYEMIYGDEKKEFSNRPEQIQELEEIAVPEQYYDDLEDSGDQ